MLLFNALRHRCSEGSTFQLVTYVATPRQHRRRECSLNRELDALSFPGATRLVPNANVGSAAEARQNDEGKVAQSSAAADSRGLPRLQMEARTAANVQLQLRQAGRRMLKTERGHILHV